MNRLFKLHLFLLVLLVSRQVHAGTALMCIEAATPEPEAIVVNDAEIPYGYMTNDFYNGAFLRELFGPTHNDFKKWLEWLESDEKTPEPVPGINIYLTSHGRYAISKVMEYPIDAGIMQIPRPEDRERRVVDLMTFDAAQGSHFKGTAQIAKKARAQLLDYVDSQFFGIYGALKKNTAHNYWIRTIGADLTLSASIYRRMKYRAGHIFHERFPEHARVPTSPIHDFEKVSTVINKNAATVTVKIDLNRKPENRNQEVIQQMFFITHWQMVQKSYRESGLFPNSMESTVMLLNDFIKTMETSKNNQQIYLMYEREAWESMLFRMNLAHQYVSVHMSGGPGYQPARYQTISDVFAPFYPLYGLAIERHASGQQELKRLFSNDNPDPLHVIPGELEIGKSWNLEFYLHVAEQLEPNSDLLVVSKTPIHTRLYKGIGFEVESSKFYAPWNANKDTLRGTREGFIDRLRQRIQIQSGS